ncbi:hypothetical protein PVAP13_5KG678907 [Panicum virgatum]|uniref:Uncharacterized protein n=1 Tax=Panicum virgatum TaxID=38727 RepID=A0A8T0SS77_PANVG|nr:hypothetical protein PVAP13_5KG678907 [Panicum virgatum]
MNDDDGLANVDRAYCIRWPTCAHKFGRAVGGGVFLPPSTKVHFLTLQVLIHSNGLFAEQQRKLVQESGWGGWTQLAYITFMWSISWLKGVKVQGNCVRR